MPKRKTTKQFIDEVSIIHNNFYVYDNVIYINNKTKVDIICPIHGLFKQAPNYHLTQGCPDCGILKRNRMLSLTKSEFLLKAIEIHNDFYDYSNICYINSKTKILINCPFHGVFKQAPSNHIYGNQGCPSCGELKRGYGLIHFLENNSKYANLKAYLYFIKFYNKAEEFFKSGVTIKPIHKRFYGYNQYELKLISEVETTMLDAYKKEAKFKLDFCKYKYIPRQNFSGWTECFKSEIYNVMFSSG